MPIMSTRAWVLFGVVSIVWGMPYFFIKIAVRELDPTVIVFVRTLLAAAVMLPLALYRRELGRALRHWKAGLLLTFAEIVIPFLLITYGERRVSSSLAGLLIAALPLVVALLAIRLDVTERVTGLRLFGMLVGLSGVALVLGFNLGGGWPQVIGAAMILGATLCYAGGTFILKLGLSDAPTFGVVAATTSVATVLLAPFALVHLPATAPSASVWVSMAGLGTICTAVAFVAYFALVTEAGPGRATVITYINPAVAVVLGVWLLGEPLTATVAAGFLLIIAGSWLSTGGTLPPRLLATGRRLRPTRRSRREAHQLGAEVAS
jgi:drug/metabolite transporter (DMT)-like permease